MVLTPINIIIESKNNRCFTACEREVLFELHHTVFTNIAATSKYTHDIHPIKKNPAMPLEKGDRNKTSTQEGGQDKEEGGGKQWVKDGQTDKKTLQHCKTAFPSSQVGDLL